MRSSAVCWASAALASAAFAGEPADSDAALDEILRRMASTPGVEAVFEERKELALLAAPLETRGVIYFVPPDRFARFTTSPGTSALLVTGDAVQLREGSDAEAIDLSGNRVARVFVENFVALWSGDRDRLERLYTPEFRGTREAWELRLAPRRAPLADAIARITLRGDRDALQELVVEERDGDRTTTRFGATRSDRAFTAAELQQIFSVGAPLDGVHAEP
jgi:outer membrane lipoprotein carrier protein LolA